MAEQLLYEIGDPTAYLVPDVACDFSQVRLQELGPHVVRVSGGRGRAPPESYKVCCTVADGYASVIPWLGALRGMHFEPKRVDFSVFFMIFPLEEVLVPHKPASGC